MTEQQLSEPLSFPSHTWLVSGPSVLLIVYICPNILFAACYGQQTACCILLSAPVQAVHKKKSLRCCMHPVKEKLPQPPKKHSIAHTEAESKA